MKSLAKLMTSSLIVSGVLFLSGCDYIPLGTESIGKVSANPASFDGREVKLSGVADRIIKIPLVGTQGYYLRDKTGDVFVFSEGSLPAEGEEIIVRGRVNNLLIVGGQSFGVSFKESAHQKSVLGWLH